MRVLLVEDDALIQRAFVRLIKSVHPLAAVDVVDTAADAIAHLDARAYDYVVSDHDLRAGTGGDVLRHARARHAHLIEQNRFILMSGHLRPAVTDLGHPITLEKPVAPQRLRTLLAGGLE